MMWESPDDQYDWLQRRYVENLRRNLGDEEARAVLSEDEQAAYVADAMLEIDGMRDPPPMPDDDEVDDDEDEELFGGEG